MPVSMPHRPMKVRVTQVRVPHRPSTPSEQLVALMDTHSPAVATMTNNTGGICQLQPPMAMEPMSGLKFRKDRAVMRQTARSMAPFLYSFQGVSLRSSR